jgi:hypothetical protein
MTMPPDIPTLPEGWVWTTQEVIFQRLKYSSREDLKVQCMYTPYYSEG